MLHSRLWEWQRDEATRNNMRKCDLCVLAIVPTSSVCGVKILTHSERRGKEGHA